MTDTDRETLSDSVRDGTADPSDRESKTEDYDESDDPGLVDGGRRYRTLSIGNNATKRRP
ncbi:MAG: hypothetical protein U5K37_08695 [Natrialbaceae archaeon]|nr:hypothetical protein [Natrialbaceae archaeon]